MDNPVLTQWLTQPDGLATQLRAIRETAGLSGTALATELGWAQSRVSRIQGGRILPTAHDIEQWCAACGHSSSAPELIEILAEASARQMRWTQRLARGQRSNQAAYTTLNRRAQNVTLVETAVIPGPLQTPDYATAMLTAMGRLRSQLPTDDLAEAVAHRMERAALIYEPDRPYQFIINEPALLGSPATAQVMIEQLQHLLTAAELPNIDLSIIPLQPGLPVVPINSFGIYTIDGQDLVLVETFSGETEYTNPSDIADHQQVLHWLTTTAANGDNAKTLIRRAIEHHRQPGQ